MVQLGSGIYSKLQLLTLLVLTVQEVIPHRGCRLDHSVIDRNLCLELSIKGADLYSVIDIVKKGADVNTIRQIGKSPLSQAIYNGNLEIAKFLLSQGANLNEVDPDELTPLGNAVSNGNVTIVEYLLSIGSDPCKSGFKGKSPLSLAVRNEEWESITIMEILLNHGADTTIQSALFDAIELAELEKFEFLLEKGASVNVTYKNGYTPLTKAVEMQLYSFVKVLIEHGADPNVTLPDGELPTAKLLKNDNYEILKYLIDNGARSPPDLEKCPQLLHYIKNNNFVFIKLLIKMGANINAVYSNGKSPLMTAMDDQNLKMVKFLVENGAELPSTEKINSYLLKYIENNSVEMIKWLIEKKVNVNAKLNDGSSFLVKAMDYQNLKMVKILVENGAELPSSEQINLYLIKYIENNSVEMIKWLIEKNVNVNVKLNDGSSFLVKAVESKNPVIVKILIDKGAIVNQTVDNKKNLLSIAALNHDFTIIKILIEAGADVESAKEELDLFASWNEDFHFYLEKLKKTRSINCKISSIGIIS